MSEYSILFHNSNSNSNGKKSSANMSGVKGKTSNTIYELSPYYYYYIRHLLVLGGTRKRGRPPAAAATTAAAAGDGEDHVPWGQGVRSPGDGAAPRKRRGVEETEEEGRSTKAKAEATSYSPRSPPPASQEAEEEEGVDGFEPCKGSAQGQDEWSKESHENPQRDRRGRCGDGALGNGGMGSAMARRI